MGCFLATVWEGRKEGGRERGRGPGIAAPMGAQRTGCSCCLLGNQNLRGRDHQADPLGGYLTILTCAPPKGFSPEAEVGGDGRRQPEWGFPGKDTTEAGAEMTLRGARSVKKWG